MPLTPLAVENVPQNKILAAVKSKILGADGSFSASCLANFGRTPLVYSLDGLEDQEPLWEPPLSRCPAVRIDTISTPPEEDHGSGVDEWVLSLGILVKYEVRDRRVDKVLASNYELMRTLFQYHRVGTMDPIRQAFTGLKRYHTIGDTTPNLLREGSGGPTTAKTFFILQIEMVLGLLG